MKRSSRNIVLAFMIALAAVCSAMIPKSNITSDMTEFLPQGSRMKEGLDSLKTYFPLVNTNAPTIRLMFSSVENSDSISKALSREECVERFMSLRQKDSLTLFELMTKDSETLDEDAAALKAKYDGCIAAETNAVTNMPRNMGFILVLAGILIFVILLVMCSSFMEAFLFIITIGLAVLMNIGTNFILPRVSMITTSIVGVLQFVLSMDYSIILMNRYRSERQVIQDSEKAMSSALRKASTSILSSSMTTITGLLVLVLMRFRIGLDLGVVLSKGVFFSLISVYTILPALILDFEKAIGATAKKVFLMPTDSLARFELKYRWPLAIVFAGLFAVSFIMQRRTELSYSNVWESEIADVFEPRNSFMILYRTDDEDAMISISDSLVKDPKVVSVVNYPSIMKRKLTANRMCANLGQMMQMLPPGQELPVDSDLLNERTLRILYYAASHPRRDERISFDDMLTLASEAEKMGLMPAGMSIDALMNGFVQDVEKEFPEEPAPAEGSVSVVEDTVSTVPAISEVPDTVVVIPASDSIEVEAPHHQSVSRFTYENCNIQMSSDALAAFMDSGLTNTKAIFKMAGKKGQTMSPSEFIHFASDKILSNAIMKKAVSAEQRKGLEETLRQVDSALAAGPSHQEVLLAQNEDILSDTLACPVEVAAPSCQAAPDSLAFSEASFEDRIGPERPAVEETTPLDRLTEMVFSGKKYTLNTLYRAISAAGIKIDRSTLELMYLYYGSQKNYDENTSLSIEELVDFLSNDVAHNPMYDAFIPYEAKASLGNLDEMISGSIGALRGGKYSMAAIVTDYSVESDDTFDFVARLHNMSDASLAGNHYAIGEPVMYKEMKDGFRKELLFLTLLTIIAIFLIVAISFRSAVIPVILVMSVLTGVFVNVYVSGIGGSKMLYLAYLIVQSILMGATIDYGILFTNFYLDFRHRGLEKLPSMQNAYKSSIHTIMTSGMIMVLAPYVLAMALTDPTIRSILTSLSTGALSAILVIIFLLPAALASCDRIIVRQRKK